MARNEFNDEVGFKAFPWPGIQVWRAKIEPCLIDPDAPADVATKNPTERVLSALIMLGVDPIIQANCERFFREPRERLGEAEMRDRLSRGIPLRAEYCRTRVVWQPGEVVILPRAWWSSLRTERNGSVVGGLVPQLVLEGERNPPALHSSIAVDNGPEVATGRRRK